MSVDVPPMSSPIALLVTAEACEVAAGDRAGGDPGGGQADGEPLSALRRHHAAARVEQQQVAVVAALG